MITFRETLDSVQRLDDLLAAGRDDQVAFDRALRNLADLQDMLSHERLASSKSVNTLLEYIERVAVPQLFGVRESLSVSANTHFDRLSTASEMAARLRTRLQVVADDSQSGYLDVIP
jgi:hypothetical protein